MNNSGTSTEKSGITAEAIRGVWSDADSHNYCGEIPKPESIRDLVRKYTEIAFPQLANRSGLSNLGSKDPAAPCDLEQRLSRLHSQLVALNCWALAQPDRAHGRLESIAAESRAAVLADRIIAGIPATIRVLQSDINAAMNGDPACRSREEVLICYPGFRAILVHRLAHQMYLLESPLAARVLAEWVHGETGIDIHPGATIGNNFFIDHGTGVVIGETCVVGNRVRVYQGVTLGAVNFPRLPTGELVRDTRRHPTIGDDVVIYANASVLGGETVIGDRCLIGSSVWLTESVAADTRVVMEKPRLRVRAKNADGTADYQI